MAGEITDDNRRKRVLAVLEELEVPLTRYVYRMWGDLEVARDVVQHAFLQLCRQPPGQFPNHPKPWLFTVCRNRMLDLLKRSDQWQELSDTAADRRPDPAALAERNDLNEWLRVFVEQLPRSQREVIELWSHGFRYREIAELTHQSEVGVRVTAHRALQRLRTNPAVRAILADENQPLAR